MGDLYEFSLLIGSQYKGGPLEWDEQQSLKKIDIF